MYKDKDKQREADRARQKRRRDKIKVEGVMNTGRDGQGVTKFRLVNKLDPSNGDVRIVQERVEPKRGKDIKCFADLPPDVQEDIDKMSTVDGKIDQTIKANRTAIAVNYQHLFPDRYEPTPLPSCCVRTESDREGYKPASELKPGEYNHVSKPGDADYDGIVTPEWIAERGR